MATSFTRLFSLGIIVLYTTMPFFASAMPSGPDCRLPLASQPFAIMTNKLTPSEAGIVSKRIIDRIRRAGEAVHAQNLGLAIRILDDPHAIDGSGFELETDRPTIDPDIRAATEREFHNHLIRTLKPKPGFSTRARFIIPHPPAKSTEWADRAFIRIASEELGHLAQKLDERAHPGGGAISKMMTGTGKAIFEYLRQVEDGVNLIITDETTRPSPQVEETDIYAFLIEVFGSKFIPFWYGTDSGHGMRVFVDQTLHQQGVPDRLGR